MKQGDTNYDPTQKYQLIWYNTTYNTNCLIFHGGLDCMIDETTWANGGFANVHNQIHNKPRAWKGVQYVICLDVHQ